MCMIYAPTNCLYSLIAKNFCMSVVTTHQWKGYKSTDRKAYRILSFVYGNIFAMIYNQHKSILIYYAYVGRVDYLLLSKLLTSITWQYVFHPSEQVRTNKLDSQKTSFQAARLQLSFSRKNVFISVFVVL